MRTMTASAITLVEPVTTAIAAPPDTTIRVRPFQFDPELTVEVPLVRWPDGVDRREQCHRVGRPCLLVVRVAERAPTQWSELEDWVRESAARAEFVTRATTVARRADQSARPCLDHARAVRFRGRTVIVPETHTGLVALLVERFGETVSDAEIRGLYDAEGVSTHAEAVKTSLRRLKDMLAPLGLHLARVRAAGYLLDRAD